VRKSAYDEAYFEGRKSNYWWTVGSYANMRQFPHWKEMLRLIRGFKKGGRLLDVGCAYGFLVNEASKHFEAYGIDISSFAVKKSKEHCNGNTFRASANSLPFRDESFDAITLVDTLEHVPDFNGCLKDAVRALKKGGVLLLQVPNPLVWADVCSRIGLDDETHVNNFRLAQWRGVLLENSVRIEKCLGFISFAFRKSRFFIKSERAMSLFPELWIIATK
jgi:ubiquinone/menaquinone biosynthesis C-methylase UbiE